MSKGLVLVYDDDEKRNVAVHFKKRLDVVSAVTKNFDVEVLDTDALIKSLVILAARRASFRKNSETAPSGRCPLDKCAVLVLDYDLFEIASDAWSEQDLTGEEVAYLARCFSTCGVIVGVNQFGDNPFDLTLKGKLGSFADLNIGGRQLDNPGLWGGPFPEFRPWTWPDLSESVKAFEARAGYVQENIRRPVLEVLGLASISTQIPRSALQFLGNDPKAASFEDFVFASGNGLRHKDVGLPPRQTARVAAARLSKWLERRILPGQDLLVDAPHLVTRYPSLLRGNHERQETWNRSARFASPNDLGLKTSLIEKPRFKHGNIFSRPVWFWGEIAATQEIPEVREPWSREDTSFEFCEDTSSFHRRSECREFLAEVDSPYVQRFVRNIKGADYRPRFRMALAK